jgi:hypothetical protein
MKNIIDKLDTVDDILIEFEDWMHGDDGKKCTEARNLLIQIRNELKSKEDEILE